MFDRSNFEKQIMRYDEIVDGMWDEIEKKIEDDGYLSRDDLKALFDEARKKVKDEKLMIGHDWGRCFVVENAKISCFLQSIHIVRDPTGKTSLTFRFPTCDIQQITLIEGFV